MLVSAVLNGWPDDRMKKVKKYLLGKKNKAKAISAKLLKSNLKAQLYNSISVLVIFQFR